MDTPKHVFKPDEKLYLFSMGKRLQVTAIFTSDDEANAFMHTHTNAAVIAYFDPFIFLADKHDRGDTPELTQAIGHLIKHGGRL